MRSKTKRHGENQNQIIITEENVLDLPIFCSTSKTFFWTEYAKFGFYFLIHGKCGSTQQVDIVNLINGTYSKCKKGDRRRKDIVRKNNSDIREEINPKRLMDMFLRFGVFSFIKETLGSLEQLARLKTNDPINVLLPMLHTTLDILFHKKQFIDHQCTVPGCNDLLVFDGHCGNRRKVCMNTRGGFNTLYDPVTKHSAKILTGCKNQPMKDGLFCNSCFEMAMKNDDLVKLYQPAQSEEHQKSTVRELMEKNMVFIEEIENSQENNRSEIKIKLFGIPKRVFIQLKNLPGALQKQIRKLDRSGRNSQRRIRPQANTDDCLKLDEMENTYACKPGVVITCQTEKNYDDERGTLVKKARGAGYQVGASPCQTVFTFYEMYRGESRLQLQAHLVQLVSVFPEKMKGKIIAYDNICKLASTIKRRRKFSNAARMLDTLIKVHDRMHLKGHSSKICQTAYNLDLIIENNRELKLKYPDYKHWNTECCEQLFSHFDLFPSLFHHTTQHRGWTWGLLLFHYKNTKNEMSILNGTNYKLLKADKNFALESAIGRAISSEF